MRWTYLVAAAASLASSVLSKELVPDAAKAAELYDSGVMMERIMAKKEVSEIFRLFFTK
jgi:hypothetical protein